MAAVIATENLSYAYGSRSILKGVSLAVETGEFVGLIGANGSGKTTLLRLLLGILRGEGLVTLDGTPLQWLPRKEIATRATMVHQDTHVDFAFTAREIVAMGRTPYLGRFTPESAADREAIDSAMRKTETESFGPRLITELSGGERQRVHLARALAQQTKVILLDEPTANLDLTHQHDALRLVRDFARSGGAAIAAIHDLSLAARFCHRLVLLSQGQIVADGPPREVINEANVTKHFGLRARVRFDEESQSLIIYPVSANGDHL